ncbi:sigma-70 family RNA polymerase sigma factor [Streptomyces sp. NPDC050704]|uniref:RNA polymerase sigma factor n=1 Tax=Streptomyces sp. NPDC050704 TaxID=3157219 RepID=UPI003437F48D
MAEWDEFEETYRVAYRPVLRFLLRRLSAGDAEDAAAEVFTLAWRRWGDRRGDDALPWLYGIARRVAANSRRTTGRAEQLGRRLELAAAEEATERSAERQVLDRLGAARALAELSETDREVLLLVAWDGLEARDAARVMGRSRAAFAVQLHRARVRLERQLARGGAATPAPTAAVHRVDAVVLEGSASEGSASEGDAR